MHSGRGISKSNQMHSTTPSAMGDPFIVRVLGRGDVVLIIMSSFFTVVTRNASPAAHMGQLVSPRPIRVSSFASGPWEKNRTKRKANFMPINCTTTEAN